MDIAPQIMVVEDKELASAGMRSLLERAGFVPESLSFFKDCESALSALGKIRPQILLLDLALPAKPNEIVGYGEEAQEVGLGLLVEILTREPATKVAIIADGVFARGVYRALRYGVSYMAKGDLLHEADIRWIIQSVLDGQLVYTRAVIPMIKQVTKSAVAVTFDEIDSAILHRVLQHMTDAEIASEVNVAEDTVGARLQRLFKRTGIRDRFLLAKWFDDYCLEM